MVRVKGKQWKPKGFSASTYIPAITGNRRAGARRSFVRQRYARVRLTPALVRPTGLYKENVYDGRNHSISN